MYFRGALNLGKEPEMRNRSNNFCQRIGGCGWIEFCELTE